VGLQKSLHMSDSRRIELVQPHRLLIYECQMRHQYKQEIRLARVYVCNDVVVVAVEQKSKLDSLMKSLNVSSQPTPWKYAYALQMPNIMHQRIDARTFELRGASVPSAAAAAAAAAAAPGVQSNVKAPPSPNSGSPARAEITLRFETESEVDARAFVSQMEEACEALRKQQDATESAIRRTRPSRSCWGHRWLVRNMLYLAIGVCLVAVLVQWYLLDRNTRQQRLLEEQSVFGRLSRSWRDRRVWN